MYEQLDGILACPDLGRAGCAGFRSPWVPQLWLQDGRCSATWDVCTPTWASGASTEPFWHPRRGPGGAKTTQKYTCFIVCYVSPQGLSRAPQELSRRSQNDPKSAPGAARMTPGAVQNHPWYLYFDLMYLN